MKLELELLPALPSCETDASRVEQILVNLLVNAIRHTPEASTVHVQVSAGDGVVRYLVRDEGSGIPDAELERVFDIYITKAAGDNRSAGVGLPLSRRLARLLGGELVALPSGPAQGGRFVLQLPATRES